MRWGLGPVFIYECLANSRRWQTYALRSAGVAALLFAMATIATSNQATTANSWRAYANLGQGYFVAMIGVELALVMLAAPAATAGAICVDRARGTLAHMLITDLSDAEIVLGKLAARLLPVLGLVACTWPVMAISSLLGGIDPIALTLAFAIIIATALLGCTTAITLSVWARKSHEVILATYTVFIVGLLVWPIWYLLSMAGWTGPASAWALLANPFYVAFTPYADPGKLEVWDYLIFFGLALAASALLTMLAVWRTRSVACRGSAEKSKGPRIGLIGRVTRWLPGPSLDRNPVLWREWHRSRPSLWMTAILALLMGTTGVFCVVGAVAFWKNGVDFRPGFVWGEVAGVCSYVLHVIFGLLMLAAIAPTSMAEERQRGSLDILAATALSTRAIVIGKWLGTFRLVLLMTIGPGVIALAMATGRSTTRFGPGLPPEYYKVLTPGARIFGVVMIIATIVAHGALITSVGLALAVWIKRQSRAIAMSVGSFVLVTAAWPILVSIPFEPDFGRKLATLSPVVILSISVNLLTNRSYGFLGGVLGFGTFWAVEVFVVAIALLWLTVRTFDGSFDRIPDLPRRLSAWAAAAIILAAMIGAGSLVGAIDYYVEGITSGSLRPYSSLGITAYSLAIAIGLALVAVESVKTALASWTAVFDQPSGIAVPGSVLTRWSHSFRLVVLLAIGPVLLALALATAHKAPRYKPVMTKNASGVQVVTSYVLAETDVPYVGEVRLAQRLEVAAVLLVTILVHGGAAVSVGLGLVTFKGWTKRWVAITAGLTVLVFFVLPLCLIMPDGGHALDNAMWSFVMASDSLLAMLVTRTSFNFSETLRSVLLWDMAFVLLSIGLYRWTFRSWQRRVSGVSKAKPALGIDLNEGHW